MTAAFRAFDFAFTDSPSKPVYQLDLTPTPRAIATRVKNITIWLDQKTYGLAARRAWLGLVKHLDAESNVTEVCVGTNKAFQEVGPDLETQLKFYLERPRKTGDLHGQAPILWTATALLH